MNISPTPKRYNSSSSRYYYDDYHSRDNNNLFDKDIRRGTGDYRSREGMQGDRILPEEYKMNSKMIAEILQEMKDLKSKLNAKDEEILRLNSVTQTLRSKVTKYKNDNERLQRILDSQNFNPSYYSTNTRQYNEQGGSNVVQKPYENIQIPKRRTTSEHDSREPLSQESYAQTLNKIYETLETLKKTVPETQRVVSSPNLQYNNSHSSNFASSILGQQPSEEDILVKESVELRNLEKEVAAVEKRLSIRHENEVRKASLQLKLSDLNDKLDMYSHASQNHHEHDLHRNHNHLNNRSHDFCKECNKSHHVHDLSTDDLKSKINPELSTNSILETPTPIKR